MKSLVHVVNKHIMKTPYCKVILDLSKGSAYEYKQEDVLPTVIEYGRMHDGKFKTGCISGNFTYNKIMNIAFLIKRGCDESGIEEHSKIEY